MEKVENRMGKDVKFIKEIAKTKKAAEKIKCII